MNTILIVAIVWVASATVVCVLFGIFASRVRAAERSLALVRLAVERPELPRVLYFPGPRGTTACRGARRVFISRDGNIA